MSSHILSPDEIDALLQASNAESPYEGLTEVLSVVTRQMVDPLQKLMQHPVKIEGPYVESVEHSLAQVISEETYVIPVTLGRGDLYIFISQTDAHYFASEFQLEAKEAVFLLGRVWMEQLAAALGAYLNKKVPLQLYQVQNLTIQEISQLPLERGSVFVRHLLRWHENGLELCLLLGDSDTLEAKGSKRPTPRKKTGSGRRILKPSTSPVTEAAFLPLQAPAHSGQTHSISLLEDIDLLVIVELGQVVLTLNELLELKPQTVIPLERHAGEAVDVYINNNAVAKGEVVVLDEHFGVRILEIVPESERIRGE